MIYADTFDINVLNTIILLLVAAGIAIAYAVRVGIKGRAHFDRVDRQGGSKILSKSVMEMGYWSLQPVARLLIFFHVSPNMLSWSSFVFGFLAGLCLVFGHFGFGALFAAFSSLLDSLDGLVARLTGVASDSGEVLDAAIDRYAEFFFCAGLVIYYREIPFLMILALAALLGSFMVSYSTAKAEALGVEAPKGSMRRPERAVVLTVGALFAPLSIQWFETGGASPVPVGYPMVVALFLVAVLANVSAGERLLAIAGAVRRKAELARDIARAQVAAAAAAEEATDEAQANPVKIR